MNIFVLDKNPKYAAQYHCDKHVCKLIIESGQMLCKAHIHSGNSQVPYGGKGFMNHPCSVWVRSSINNYRWLIKMSLYLCKEYTHRYGRIHKTQQVIEWARDNEPNIPNISMTPFVQAMPDDVKDVDAVQAYRNYYLKYKSYFAKWAKGRDTPYWYTRKLPENP